MLKNSKISGLIVWRHANKIHRKLAMLNCVQCQGKKWWNYYEVSFMTASKFTTLIYSMVQDIIWKADCHSACQKILLSCGTRRFITVFTKARSWTLSWASGVQFAPSIPFFSQYLPNVENVIRSRSVTTEPTLMIPNNFIHIWS